MHERSKAYAVQIARQDGSTFLASSGNVGPMLLRSHKAAREYADMLSEHFPRRRLRIVKVLQIVVRDVGE